VPPALEDLSAVGFGQLGGRDASTCLQKILHETASICLCARENVAAWWFSCGGLQWACGANC
jgi:hypothetical protein